MDFKGKEKMDEAVKEVVKEAEEWPCTRGFPDRFT